MLSRKKPQLSSDDFTRATTAEYRPVLSVDQLAKLIGRSPKTIYEWIAKGRLDGAIRKRGKGHMIWRDKALELLFNGKDWDS